MVRYGTKVRGYLLSTSPVSPIYTHTICTSYWYCTSYNTGYRHNTVTWHVILYPGNTFLNCSFHCLTTPRVLSWQPPKWRKWMTNTWRDVIQLFIWQVSRSYKLLHLVTTSQHISDFSIVALIIRTISVLYLYCCMSVL